MKNNRRNNNRNKKKKRPFNKIYYVVQTYPIFKTCGQAFSEKEARDVANEVYRMTGEPGKIVAFTREELQELNYKSYVPSRNS